MLEALLELYPEFLEVPPTQILPALKKSGLSWQQISLPERLRWVLSSQQGVANWRKIFSPIDRAIDEQFTNEQKALATRLYVLLQKFNLNETIQRNDENNQLLAIAVINAVREGRLTLWRYVCMPRTNLIVGENRGGFVRWEAEYDSRYDTLTKALIQDKELLAQISNLGIEPNIYFVINDWEVPFYRSNVSIKSLNEGEFELAISALETIRGYTRDWIAQTCERYGLNASGVYFFSDRELCPEYQEFLDLVDTLKLERAGLADAGILKAEIDFVIKADKSISGQSAELKAMRRIYQYAVESVFIAQSVLGKGIYLNAEYPTINVWQKMRLLQQLPTLFYVTDSQVQNI